MLTWCEHSSVDNWHLTALNMWTLQLSPLQNLWLKAQSPGLGTTNISVSCEEALKKSGSTNVKYQELAECFGLRLNPYRWAVGVLQDTAKSSTYFAPQGLSRSGSFMPKPQRKPLGVSESRQPICWWLLLRHKSRPGECFMFKGKIQDVCVSRCFLNTMSVFYDLELNGNFEGNFENHTLLFTLMSSKQLYP